ncbi:MAG: hypothetical protein PHG63_00810 [Candidatus Dojkabacteria bacterium]|nr:hypothetical protein [Candidatus Dojkabacteria bacterium]
MANAPDGEGNEIMNQAIEARTQSICDGIGYLMGQLDQPTVWSRLAVDATNLIETNPDLVGSEATDDRRALVTSTVSLRKRPDGGLLVDQVCPFHGYDVTDHMRALLSVFQALSGNEIPPSAYHYFQPIEGHSEAYVATVDDLSETISRILDQSGWEQLTQSELDMLAVRRNIFRFSRHLFESLHISEEERRAFIVWAGTHDAGKLWDRYLDVNRPKEPVRKLGESDTDFQKRETQYKETIAQLEKQHRNVLYGIDQKGIPLYPFDIEPDSEFLDKTREIQGLYNVTSHQMEQEAISVALWRRAMEYKIIDEKTFEFLMQLHIDYTAYTYQMKAIRGGGRLSTPTPREERLALLALCLDELGKPWMGLKMYQERDWASKSIEAQTKDLERVLEETVAEPI